MSTGVEDRAYWIEAACKIVEPVLSAASERRLEATMPIEARSSDRVLYSHLEAMARSLVGIAPWLELAGQGTDQESVLRRSYADMARRALDAITDPRSPDYANFHIGLQPIVDAAFLAHAILRAPHALWKELEPRVKRNVIAALAATRSRKPYFDNWLLFAGIIEAALYFMGEDWDPMRIDYALKQHAQWYLGDGVYGDGPELHWDYYNSFVIQPMLIDILITMQDQCDEWRRMLGPVLERAQRYAEILERSISPEATFPPIGRSLAYRFGAFQLLSQMSLRRALPPALPPAQVRCALTAVMRRMLEAPGTFDAQGWLRIGFVGHQPDIGEYYISTGSLYLCTAVFLPLGLPAADPFWQDAPLPWTARRAWTGEPFPVDSAIETDPCPPAPRDVGGPR